MRDSLKKALALIVESNSEANLPSIIHIDESIIESVLEYQDEELKVLLEKLYQDKIIPISDKYEGFDDEYHEISVIKRHINNDVEICKKINEMIADFVYDELKNSSSGIAKMVLEKR